jgi:hypothetical protein
MSRLIASAADVPVILQVCCAHCAGAVELECEGLPGFWGYETYNEYFCPHCRKQNHQRSSGAVVTARVPAADPETVGAVG